MVRKGEKGNMLVYFLIFILCIVLCFALISIVQAYISKNSHIITIRDVPRKVPWAMVQAIPVTQLDQAVEAAFPCTMHIRLMYLDGTGYIPDDGRFGMIQAPIQKHCEQISWAVGTLGYEPEKDYANSGGNFQFTTIGMMATVGGIPRGDPMLNPEYDPEFNPTMPVKDWWKNAFACSLNFLQQAGAGGIPKLVDCGNSDFFNYAMVDWKGPGPGYQCTIWILTHDDDNIGVYCINEMPELVALLDIEKVSPSLMRDAVNLINGIPDNNKPWYKQFGQ